MIVCEETSELKAARRRSRSSGGDAGDDDDRESMVSVRSVT
jgi:hypothetical protein